MFPHCAADHEKDKFYQPTHPEPDDKKGSS
mgnify:CR=1 FL=1